MPAHDVDAAAIAVVVERVLDEHVPLVLAKEADDGLDQGGVVRVEESGQVCATPARVEGEADVERGADAWDDIHAKHGQVATLGQGDPRLVDAGKSGKVRLTPAAASPNGPG